jgi:acetyl/propionyl-CoA carboxylase alpha subunit
VLEETPSPLLDEATREALTGAAVRLGAAAAYRSAGTVEFIFDEDDRAFYFLEVNTRLQVGHGGRAHGRGERGLVGFSKEGRAATGAARP